MTKRPLPPAANNDPPHLAQREPVESVAIGIEDLLRESLGFGVAAPKAGRSKATALSGVCSLRLLAKSSRARTRGLRTGGEEGPDDCVRVSEMSGIRSGVEGVHDTRDDHMLEALTVCRSPGEPLILEMRGIRDGVDAGEFMMVEFDRRSGEAVSVDTGDEVT